MRIAEHVDVLAPPSIVWEQVSDPSRVLDFFAGVTRWESVGGPRSGLGARYRMLMRVGSAEVGGLIEVVEFSPERDLAWHSVTGIDQRGRWRMRVRGECTRVELRIQFGAPRRPLGLGVGAVRGADRARERAARRWRSSSARSSTSGCGPRRPAGARPLGDADPLVGGPGVDVAAFERRGQHVGEAIRGAGEDRRAERGDLGRERVVVAGRAVV